MGNCQAIDAATLVIQHPNGKVENLYWPIPASQIMKMNPGHYVALLITTTTISHTTTAAAGMRQSSVRITRVKLLRPTETLALGHVYRLISTQEVMKGLVAKKQAKMRKNGIEIADSEALKDAEKFATRSQQDVETHQVSKHEQRSRMITRNGGTARPRSWQPSLHSISEGGNGSQLLRLNAFRGEPASSGFEWHFTPNHNSSADSSTSVGSDFHLVSSKLHPRNSLCSSHVSNSKGICVRGCARI